MLWGSVNSAVPLLDEDRVSTISHTTSLDSLFSSLWFELWSSRVLSVNDMGISSLCVLCNRMNITVGWTSCGGTSSRESVRRSKPWRTSTGFCWRTFYQPMSLNTSWDVTGKMRWILLLLKLWYWQFIYTLSYFNKGSNAPSSSSPVARCVFIL